jgi:endoglucanase
MKVDKCIRLPVITEFNKLYVLSASVVAAISIASLLAVQMVIFGESLNDGVNISASPHTPMIRGVNLAGNDGYIGKTIWPTDQGMDYYLAKGMNVFRIMTLWETLQPTLDGPLDENALAGLDHVIKHITTAGAVAVIDFHNYGRRKLGGVGSDNSPAYIIGETSQVNAENFANGWSKMAAHYQNNPRVWLELTNEPHDQDTAILVATYNTVISAIRKQGATNKILLDGNIYSTGERWAVSYRGSKPNSEAVLDIVDSGNNYAFDVHQYLDFDGSGQHQTCESGAGATRLGVVTRWAELNRKDLFLGEFGTGKNVVCYAELQSLLNYVETKGADVYLGWTFFAALAGEPPYNKGERCWYCIDPVDFADPVEDPRMTVLLRHLPKAWYESPADNEQ